MDLVNRLKFFMDYMKVTISQFADTCNIPRPSMSQLMNGRNKRISDEVINKIHNGYPSLNIMWLMFGEGEMEIGKNIQISEAQNPAFEGSSAPQSTDNQGSQQLQSAYFGSQDSDPNSSGTPVSGTNLEPSLFDTSNSDYSRSSGDSRNAGDIRPDAGEPKGISFDHTFDSSTPYSTNEAPAYGAAAMPQTDAAATQHPGHNNPYPQQQSQQPHQPAPYNNTTDINTKRSDATGQPTSQQAPAGGQPGIPASGNPEQRHYDNRQQPAPAAAFQAHQPASDQSRGPLHPNDITRTVNAVSGPSASPLGADDKSADNAFKTDANDGIISISPDSRKKITNIVVFYSDNSFQSFIPDA